jgi:hypothetical protein
MRFSGIYDHGFLRNVCAVTFLIYLTDCLGAAENSKQQNQLPKPEASKSLMAVIPPAKWQELEKSVDRGLTWMASQQGANGSFHTLDSGQPGITSLAAMAFLSRGYQPGLGPYGERLNRAIDFVLSCQMSNGLITLLAPGPVHEDKQPSHNAVYNHVISSLMLAEIYGQVNGKRAREVKQTIERAILFSGKLHHIRAKPPIDQGGWRYIRVNRWGSGVDSDLSVTCWHLMFLRSAKNAEFNVPQADVDEAIEYVRRLWNPGSGAFSYDTANLESVLPFEAKHSRGMVGAGILCLSMAGDHDTAIARAAGDWLLAHPYRGFGHLASASDRFFYGTYYSSQAMMQLGGRYWEKYYPLLVEALLSGQSSDGSWPPEIRSSMNVVGAGSEAMFGKVYTSALAVLSLTPPYQLLPIYQR